MSVPYNGVSANVAGLTQVTVTNPVDGDAFNAAADVARTNTEADWAQRLIEIVTNVTGQGVAAFAWFVTKAWTWTLAQTFSALATFNAGLSTTTVAASGNASAATLTATAAGSTIQAPTPLVVGGTGVAFAANMSAGAQGAPRYWVDPFGVVHVNGSIQSSSANASQTMFTLPVGYRPTAIRLFPTSDFGAAPDSAQPIQIATTGICSTLNYTGAGRTINLDGITFETF